ncbi:MAG TPA: phosphopantothenoylcysteine decarboxylase [Verrucomicrobiae bacterium]|jgi:phosphopantothenoylcysteine decarboxylase/phosphopantothenate--cysteine ligase|nr:phosphopantothenoylcysteine decarboxylase [Verrucomicrobiae bacterium]
MNCVVTAGPTYEPLDEVRRLTNFSTGRLGTGLCNYLTARGHTVTLFIGEMAVYSGYRKAKRVESFTTTADLRERLKALAAKKVDAIFHAAAVGDFSFGQVFEAAANGKGGKLTEIKEAKKISTRLGKLLVELLPTPKIIADLRGWYPKTKIVGWKFEVDGSRADVLAAAQKQLADCGTDLCVVNGPAYGEGFGLVGGKGAPGHLPNPPVLFDALEKFVRV